MSDFTLTSQAFADGETIPPRFTCEGENISPPLTVGGIPEDTETLVLLVTDPDIPDEVKDNMGIEVFDHWVVYNIPVNTSGNVQIAVDEAPGTEGVNSSGEVGYTGPCPPAEYKPTEHRYTFSFYALDAKLDVSPQASKEAVMSAMKSHIIDRAELVGRYEKQQV